MLLVSAIEFGQYVSAWKCVPLVILLLIWARLLTWVDKDAEAAHLPRLALNTGFIAGFILAFLLFLFMPSYLIALVALVAVFAVEVVAYLILRQQKVGLGDLTQQFNNWLRGLFRRDKSVTVSAGQVMLFGRGSAAVEPPASDSPERGGYEALQEMMTEPLKRNAERIELQPTEGSSTIKYWVDGVSIDGTAVNRNDAGAAAMLLRKSMGLDTSDARKPQLGNMKAALDGKKHDLEVLVAGSTAGQSIIIEIDAKKRHDIKLDEMGFSDEQMKIWDSVVSGSTGIVLLATPRGQGLTTLLYAVLRRHDAFLSHIQTIEHLPPTDLEGITQNELAPNATGAEEAKLVTWVCSQEPDVVMIDKVEDAKSASELIKFSGTGKRVYVGMRAGNTFDALATWRKLVGNEKLAMQQLSMVVAGRVMRKLCVACKQEYNPDPETLRRLNMSPDRVGRLFQARGPGNPMRDNRGHPVVCEFCQGLGFKGRVGVYEVFLVDDEVRQTVAAGGSVNQLKMLFKKQRRRYLQEQAVACAMTGDTSLQEVARVLKSEPGPPSSSGGGGTGGGAPRSSGGGGGAGGGGGGAPRKPAAPSAPRRPAKSS